MKHILQVSVPLVFLTLSIPIFLKVFSTSELVIDEKFHLQQGLHYCNQRFDVWDSKITTFPGLYIAACLLIPFQLCSTFGLRLISLLASTVNLFLMIKIRKHLVSTKTSLAVLDALSISILPPLYFFNHLYYTEALSLTTILSLMYFWSKNLHTIAAIFGGMSILMRQTNVVWVAMFLGISSLDILIKNYSKTKQIKYSSVSLTDSKTLVNILTSFSVIWDSVLNVLITFYGYILVILLFITFVLYNGSIVVGDKSAHEATLHIPQLFYYSLFTIVFAISLTLTKCMTVLNILRRNLGKCILAVIVCILIAKFNTQVHPYLLADNRLYKFYIWSRFYGKYEWFKYAVTPIYVFGLVLINKTLDHKTMAFKLMFWLALLPALCLQKLLEFRYFLIPFVIYRLNSQISRTATVIFIEIMYYILINAITFYIFFTKEIFWNDIAEVQRLMW